jgi:hypothetical protein
MYLFLTRYLTAFRFLLLIALIMGCKQMPVTEVKTEDSGVLKNERIGINELRPGDILVRPNLNFFPGSAFVPNGSGFGHAAIVTTYYQHDNMDSLLANVQIIESIAKDVPKAFQIREVKALNHSKIPSFNNVNFDKRYSGSRYRLRLDLPAHLIDRVILFARQQKGDRSAWNAAKRFPGHPFADSLVAIGERNDWADNNTWYCSLLVWQSFLKHTGIDLDPNGGYMVYPNDLIASPVFDRQDTLFTGRARF